MPKRNRAGYDKVPWGHTAQARPQAGFEGRQARENARMDRLTGGPRVTPKPAPPPTSGKGVDDATEAEEDALIRLAMSPDPAAGDLPLG